MTKYFWVGGTGTLSSASNSTRLSLTSGGAPVAAVVLANTDDVVVDANSGTGSVTIGTLTIRSLDFSAAPSTIAFIGAGTITMSGSTSNGLGFALKWGGAGAHTFTGIINYTNTVVATLDAVFAVTFGGTFRVNATNADIRVSQTGGNGVATLAFTLGKLTALTDITTTTSLTTAAGAKVWVMTGSIICTGSNSFVGQSTSSSGTGVIKLRSSSINPTFDGLPGAGFPTLVWEPCDRQVATFSGWSATLINSAFKIDASVQAGVKTATIDFGGVVMTTSTFTTFTTTINSGQRIQLANSSGTIKATSVTMSNLTFLGPQTLAGTGTWSGTNIGAATAGGAITGLTASVGANQFFVGGSGAMTIFNGTDSNNWASSTGGVAGTGRSPLPQDNIVVDGNSGTGTLTANTSNLCVDLTVTGGPTFACGTAWAGYTATISSSGGVVLMTGNVSFTVNASQAGRIGVGNSKTIKMPLGPHLFPVGNSPGPALSGNSEFCGVYAGSGKLDMAGFNLTLDGIGTFSVYLLEANGALGFTGFTVGTGTLTLLAPVTGYIRNGALGTPTIDVTGGTIAFSGGKGGANGFPDATTTFTGGASATLKILGAVSTLQQCILIGANGGTTWGSVVLDKRAYLTLAISATYVWGALTTTNASSSNHSKLDTNLAGTVVHIQFGSTVLIDNCDVVDNDADTTVPAVTRNGSISNTTDWTSLLTQTIGDVLGLVDSQVKTPTRLLTDVLGAVDTRVRTATRTTTDALGIVDAQARNVTRVITDILGLVDARSKSVAFTLTDVVGLVDSRSKTVIVPISDVLGMVDNIESVAATKVITDVLGLVDSEARTVNHVIVDVLGATDTASTTASLTIVDIVGLVDSHTLELDLVFVDQVGLTDTQARAVDRHITDILGATDLLSKNVAVTIADILGVVDQMRDVRQITFLIVDTLGLHDNLGSFDVYTGRTVTDHLGLADALTEAFNRGWKPRIIAF